MNTNTSTIERISLQTRQLPESFQREVLHYVEYLVNKAKKEVRDSRQEELEWQEFSLVEASRGIEDDDIPDYTEADFKEKWK